jgi:hypothetical protein
MKGLPLAQLLVMFAVILIVGSLFKDRFIGGGRR